MLAWIAPVPWLLSMRGRSGTEALWLGAVFGASLSLTLGAWIPGVIANGFETSRIGGIALWLGLSLSYVPAVMAVSWLASWVGTRSPYSGPLVGASWGLGEISYALLWPGVPWITIGATQIETPLASLAALVGVHGVSAMVIGGAAVFAQAMGRERRARPLLAALAIGCAVVGVVRLPPAPSAVRGQSLRVALVQPAVPMSARLDSRFERAVLEELERLTTTIEDADLIVWPETSLRSTLEGRPDLEQRLQAVVDARGVPLVLGAPRKVPGGRANSVALLAPGRVPRPIYDKLRPLPVAEYQPVWLAPFMRRWLGAFVPPIPWSFGRPISRDLSSLGSPEIAICYEAAFSDRPRDPRAGFLLNLVNDGWYDRTPAALHHLLLARMRAVEIGAPLLRVANTGISAVVGPDGALVASLPLRRPGVLRAEVLLSARVTPFERVGYWPLGALAALLTTAELRRRYSKPTGSGSKAPEITA
jgi:apolipoprotein N-acyltransferase